MTTATPTKITARQAYDIRAAEIAKQIKQLQAFQKSHAAAFAKTPGHWGYAGDLAHARNLLEQAIAAVGGPQVG